MKALLRSCPVCGNGNGDVLHSERFAVFDDYPLPAGYDVVACSSCGMVFADTPATQADYERYYATCSIYQDASGIAARDGDTRREIVNRAARLTRSQDARILDIGCANGELLACFRKAGFRNVVGVDPSPMCVANTRTAGTEAWQGWLSALPPEVGRCDLVILNSVLEHVLDVRRAIQSAISVCGPQGCLFLKVPDAEAYADHVSAPFQEFNTEHINHFSPESLNHLMGQFGFTCRQRDRLVLRIAAGVGAPQMEVGYGRGEATAASRSRLAVSMARYIAISRELMSGLNRQMEAVLARSPEVVAWGCGQLAMKLLCQTALADARIIAWVDGNRINHGRRLRGVPVLAPEELNAPDVPVLITTLLHADAIETRIRSLGWRNPVMKLSSGGAY